MQLCTHGYGRWICRGGLGRAIRLMLLGRGGYAKCRYGGIENFTEIIYL